jgi:hypothetical protein
MLPEATKFCSFPDGAPIDDIKEFMNLRFDLE